MSQIPVTSPSVGDSPVAPAAGIWSEASPADPEEQVAYFRQHGFVVLRGVAGPAALVELDAEVQRFARDHRSLTPVREGFQMEDASRWPSPGEPVFRKIGGQFDLSPAFRALGRSPRVMAFLIALYGPVVTLYRDVIMMKQARVGREKPWHQDAVYWPYRPMEQASCLFALDSMGADNGGLQVVPGSHLLGPLPHHSAELQVTLTPELQARTVYVDLAAGDALIFHALLLHGSEPNVSPRHRRVSIFSYMAPHFVHIGHGTPLPAPVVYDANVEGPPLS